MITIRININLLKLKFKKAFLRLLKVLAVALLVVGIALIISTPGASEIDNISVMQMFFKGSKGFALCGVAYVVNFIKIALQ